MLLRLLATRSKKIGDKYAGTSLLWRLISESVPQHRGRYAAAIGAMVLVAITTSLSAWVMGLIVDVMGESENFSKVVLVSVAVLLIFVAKGLASFAQVALMARAGNRIVAQKQLDLFRRLLNQGVLYFNNNESSELLVRVTQSAQMARRVIDTIVTGFVRDFLTLFGLLGVMFYQQPALSLIALIVGPAALYGVRRILAKVRSVMEQEMAGLSEIIRVVQETSVGARVVKAFALEPLMERRMSDAITQVETRANKIARLEAATTPLMDTITGAAISSIVILSSVSFLGQNVGTPGQLMSFVTAFLMAYEPAKRLSRMRVTIEGGMVGVRMMYELLDTPETLKEIPGAIDLPNGPGQVNFDNVYFSFSGGQNVINGVTLAFPFGKTSALVGPSGGGKSTLLNLALRLFDPDTGTVSIDGMDIRNATFSSLRSKISYVGQDTFLFSSSVMENIRVVRPEASDEDVIEAAKIANAHEFIEKLANGYLTQIGENGTFLSGGQRQRLSIARAVLRNSQILLLDEATSALDSHSESLVRGALARVTKNVTTIVVAHRLSTVRDSDQIIYIESGRVLEVGTFDELMAIGGKFKALHDEQFR